MCWEIDWIDLYWKAAFVSQAECFSSLTLMRRTQKWKESTKKNMQCSLRRCESNIKTTIKKKNWAFYSVTWAVAVVSVQTSCLTLFLKITSLSAVLGDFCGFSSVPDTRLHLTWDTSTLSGHSSAHRPQVEARDSEEASSPAWASWPPPE